MFHPMFHEMFAVPIPILEKIIRPVLVYFALIVLLRVFGKRELAQLNPFDLVVLLSLSNTVQNAIIGNDNSLSGGIIGAATLLTINWLVVRVLYSSPRLSRVMGGVERTLITNGRVDKYALKKNFSVMKSCLPLSDARGSTTSMMSRAASSNPTAGSSSRAASLLPRKAARRSWLTGWTL